MKVQQAGGAARRAAQQKPGWAAGRGDIVAGLAKKRRHQVSGGPAPGSARAQKSHPRVAV